jgi:lipoate-protein ligase A
VNIPKKGRKSLSSSQVWRVIIDHEQDAYTNMAVDDALFEGQIRGESPPTLRFYSWRPPAISLGYAQKIATIDLESCRLSGISVVRRITGGRAILHEGDFTYSITAREDNPAVQGTLMDTYRKISQALLAGLQQLGLQAAFSPGDKDPCAGHAPASGAAACFAATSRYELTINGKKIIGSAQRRKQGAVLQQGSIPFQDTSKKLFSLLQFSDPGQRTLAHERYLKKATSLYEALCRPVTFDDVAAAFLGGMGSAFQVELAPGCLHPDEIEQAERLRCSKYSSHAWNFGIEVNTKGARIILVLP